VNPPLAIFAELKTTCQSKNSSTLPDTGAGRPGIQGIDLKLKFLKPDLFEEMNEHEDHFGIHRGVFNPEDLCVN